MDRVRPALISQRVRRELVGWTVVAVLSLTSLLAALRLAGIPDLIAAMRGEKRTAQFCEEHQKEREKRDRARRRR